MDFNDTYFQTIKGLGFPSAIDTKYFITRFCVAHSWYKHLSNKRDTAFIFYLYPNLPISIETIIGMEIPIQFNLSLVWNWFIEKNGCYISNNKNDCVLRNHTFNNGEEKLITLPISIINVGRIYLSRYVHSRAYANSFTYFDDIEKEKTYSTMHFDIVENLESHILYIIELIKSHQEKL